MDYQNLKIDHFEHSGFRIKNGVNVIYLDPYNLKDEQIETADYILITHEHFDHCSEKDIKKIAGPETIIIASESCNLEQKFLGYLKVKSLIFMGPGENSEVDDLKITAVPAYNLNKTFHPPKGGRVGYVVEINRTRIYYAGDTDNIPEMSKLTNIDVALLPVSGTYVMDWNEAVAATAVIKPKLVIPMHYGSVIGSLEDAQKFKENASCPVAII